MSLLLCNPICIITELELKMSEEKVISVEYRERVAVITIDNAKKLNALSQSQYYDLAQTLREVAGHDEVFITVLIGKGRFFSA